MPNFCISLLALILCFGCGVNQTKRVCIGKVCVSAEVADTPAKRKIGLMFRKNMPEDKGMLFVFEQEGIYPFWMKNTRFPLDILWIDSKKKIVDMYQNALPCKDVCKTLSPRKAASFVLEVNSGVAATHHLRIGDSVDFK